MIMLTVKIHSVQIFSPKLKLLKGRGWFILHAAFFYTWHKYCAEVMHDDVNNHRTHSSMSLKTKMNFCSRCLSAIPLMTIMMYILYYAFQIILTILI